MKKNKKRTLLEIYKSIRKFWTINPKTRIRKNKKKKTRAQNKRELNKIRKRHE